MRYPPGQSGNPSGRPPGVGRTVELRRQLFSKASEVVDAVLAKAIEGDLAASKLVLDRLVPPLRATDQPVSIPRPDGGDIVEQSCYVVDALLSGGLPASTAVQIMQALIAHQTIGELKELERRIEALETESKSED